MDAQRYFLELVEFDHWANAELLAALRAMPEGPLARQARRIFGHAVRSEIAWLGRVQQAGAAPAGFWGDDELADCARFAEQAQRQWREFLAPRSEADFERSHPYTNTEGRRYASTLREIATHVFDHASHHRAQVQVLLRQAGCTPPLLDYIHWARGVRGLAAPARQ